MYISIHITQIKCQYQDTNYNLYLSNDTQPQPPRGFNFIPAGCGCLPQTVLIRVMPFRQTQYLFLSIVMDTFSWLWVSFSYLLCFLIKGFDCKHCNRYVQIIVYLIETLVEFLMKGFDCKQCNWYIYKWSCIVWMIRLFLYKNIYFKASYGMLSDDFALSHWDIFFPIQGSDCKKPRDHMTICKRAGAWTLTSPEVNTESQARKYKAHLDIRFHRIYYSKKYCKEDIDLWKCKNGYILCSLYYINILLS